MVRKDEIPERFQELQEISDNRSRCLCYCSKEQASYFYDPLAHWKQVEVRTESSGSRIEI